MILKSFALFDLKSGAFSTPFFFPATGLAVRAIQDLANDRTTTVGRHPEDFALYELGSFNDGSGQFDPSVPVHLATVVQILEGKEIQQ